MCSNPPLSAILNRTDLAVATPDQKQVAVFWGSRASPFRPQSRTAWTTLNFAAGINSLAIADLNNDGRYHLVPTNLSANHVTVLLGIGDGTFPTSKSYAAGPEPTAVAVAGFNGDGRPLQKWVDEQNRGPPVGW